MDGSKSMISVARNVADKEVLAGHQHDATDLRDVPRPKNSPSIKKGHIN
jgi:hypothetical protein